MHTEPWGAWWLLLKSAARAPSKDSEIKATMQEKPSSSEQGTACCLVTNWALTVNPEGEHRETETRNGSLCNPTRHEGDSSVLTNSRNQSGGSTGEPLT